MRVRRLGPFDAGEIGLGCMSLSHAYGKPPAPETAREVLGKALDLGVTHFDTAALYGFGRNEELVGSFLKPHRDEIVLASKCGMRGVDGRRVIDASPRMLARDLDDSLRRLQTEVIDLYYLHRYDKRTPIEDSVGALGRFVEAGKLRAIGLSEVSAETLERAHAVHPIAAVQSEYSLFSRNVEIAVIDACRRIGAAFVAFSPLARGLLTADDLVPAEFADGDIRRGMPRFKEPNFANNRRLLSRYRAIASEVGLSPAQLALAWLLRQMPDLHVIPGTTSTAHLEENLGASGASLSEDVADRVDRLINRHTVSGPRYPAATQVEIDTEEFA